MAENLAFIPEVSPSGEGSSILPNYFVKGYNGTDLTTANSNYATFGVLYNWPAAIVACPTGWHLPSSDVWEQLDLSLGMTQSQADNSGWQGTNIASQMKSRPISLPPTFPTDPFWNRR